MSNSMSAPDAESPDARATVSITFDNLGEAVELERGTWPPGKPLGEHPSVTHVLPAILKMLHEFNFSATFFTEGINGEMYPQALQTIVGSGHEIGYHAWRHEAWEDLSAVEEEQILERGIHAMSKLGIRPSGFRPPGGILTASSARLLKKMSFVYCSPAGPLATISDGLVFLPFQWPCVDAYAYLPRFARLRESLGDSPAPLSPEHFRTHLHNALQEAVQQRSYLSLLFHPFIEEKDEYFEVMYATLKELHSLVHVGTVWSAPCLEVAQGMLRHPAIHP